MTRSGLIHPRDVEAWRRWQGRQAPLRRIRAALRRRPQSVPWLAVRGTSPAILVAVDALTPTQLSSLVRPLALLADLDVAVLAPGRLSGVLPSGDWHWHQPAGHDVVPEALVGVRAVLSVGHHLPNGALAEAWAEKLEAERVVVQHGLLTPHAPPLPANARLLAFSDADAAFAASGRDDILSVTVGSQLLWAAGSKGVALTDDACARLLYLGQLHGAELPRRAKASAAEAFCRAHGAEYRPHPAEGDVASRLQHRLWERAGIGIDREPKPLGEHGRPVVSVFSTGVLEAASLGVPAWVSYPRPPRWLEEFWDRYSMSRWGRRPTSAPPRPEREPAAAVADHVARAAGLQRVEDTSRPSRGRR
ncbi:RNA-binding protein [Sinomonas gamaensis]|uniref:RNA-binding protein n=1 Tax=Sinomonas gamaensis TaxID=2565624 RepID=UPI001BB1BBA5|nr:RNA-binding protein [Sinomonas gamaensis]